MKMKKKLAFVLAGVVAISSFAVGAMSKSIVEKIEAELRGDFTVVIDGTKQTFRDAEGNVVDPILYDGTTYLPVRAIGEIMGKTVYWYQDEKRIELVEASTDESLVTDADVIVDSSDKKDKVKEEKADRNEKLKDIEVDVTLEEAKKTVLEKAGLKENDVVFTKAKKEYDDLKVVYDIDFKTDEAKYDAEVDATSGDVTEWEVEEIKAKKDQIVASEEAITLDEAKEIALNKAGLKEKDVVFEEARLDYDDGKKVYDIEFRHGLIEYNFEIDAANGTILEWEKDID